MHNKNGDGSHITLVMVMANKSNMVQQKKSWHILWDVGANMHMPIECSMLQDMQKKSPSKCKGTQHCKHTLQNLALSLYDVAKRSNKLVQHISYRAQASPIVGVAITI